MFQDIAEVVYEARRSQEPTHQENEDGEAHEVERSAPWEELTSGEREPHLAEVRDYLHSGTPMQDALGTAIVDALK